MFDIGASLDREILNVMKCRPTVLFIEPDDPRVLEAALHLPRVAKPVFLAPRERVEETIKRQLPHLASAHIAFALGESAFCNLEQSTSLREELAHAAWQLPPEQRVVNNLEEAYAWVSTPAGFGIMAAVSGHCDVVVGGARHEPRQYFRPLLKTLQAAPVLCEVGVIILPDDHPQGLYPHNILILGDVGVNGTLTPDKLARIAVATCTVARDIIPEAELPEISGVMVSYSNHGGDEGPSPELVRKANRLVPEIMDEQYRNNERYRSISIQGEVKINVALSRRSERFYHGGVDQTDRYRGTNVLITPNLDTGNLLFHLFATRYPEAKTFSIVHGIRFRGVDLPMDVESEDAVLAVKANLLRLHRYGQWVRTPRDTFFARPRILTINPGSTSTKVAVFQGEEEIFSEELQHSASELEPFEGKRIVTQFEMRKQVVERTLQQHDVTIESIEAVSARGGLLRPIPHGTYSVNDAMRKDLLEGSLTDHASNLGALIAYALVEGTNKPAFIVDPVVVDEMEERCRVTGIKSLRRKPISHALNQIATAHRYARDHETFYEYLNLIVCHMGGGISIGAHRKGRLVDVNNALDGEGPFTPQRSGSLPVGDLIRLCFSENVTKEQMLKLNKGRGGLIDLLGTSDLKAIEQRYVQQDPEVVPVFEALGYQIGKSICSLVAAFDGQPVDRVLLTGGMARSKPLVLLIDKACAALGCGMDVYPGESEMMALAQGALRVLEGREPAKEYEA